MLIITIKNCQSNNIYTTI